MVANVLLCNGIGKIGGVETFFYEIAKKYHNLDIAIVYISADTQQLRRLSKYIRCIKLDKKIKCKKCFMMYNVGIDKIEADEYIQFIHANYKIQNMLPNVDPRVTEYYGVSKWVAKDYEELLRQKGVLKEVKVCYNPITIDKPKRVLRLISATRLTEEKGKDRMIILANELTKHNIPFIWLVFTNDFEKIDNPNVIYMNPRLDIRDYIADSDYLVQLSDTEGYPYSILESLCLSTPVIVTPVPSIIEMGANEENSYILPFNMKDIPIDDIYNKIPRFIFKPKKDKWDELLIHEESTYNPEDIVECISQRMFQYEGTWVMMNQTMFFNKEEAKELEREGKVKVVG